MSDLIHKNINAMPLTAVGGQGVWLEDSIGNCYLDACGGVAVSSLGHNHPKIKAAIKQAAKSLAWVHAGSFTTRAAEHLASLLVKFAPGLAKVQFLSGGSEAMELAVKMTYQYHWECGYPGKNILISRRQSYHGNTLSMLAISGNKQRRSIFEPLFPPATSVSPCYAYRDKYVTESDAQYAERLAIELEQKICDIGAEKIAGFIVEPVVGSTSGAVPAVPQYLEKISAICKKYSILLILDEVMCGMGRTGYHYAYIEDNIIPDIVIIGKGLAAGYQPISAVLISEKIHTAFSNGSGILLSGQTHVNHPLACAVALQVQKTICDDNLLENVHLRGKQLRALLTERLAEVECIGDIRGRGLLLGVEIVKNKIYKTPYIDGNTLAAKIKQEALNQHLLIYPGAGTIDGLVGNHVLFAPPFIVTSNEIEVIVDKFCAVIHACFS